jgi:hypothetical protein
VEDEGQPATGKKKGETATDHLVDRVREVEHLIAPRQDPLNERTLLELLLSLAGARDEEDLSLTLLATSDDLVERSQVAGSGGVEANELEDALAVLGIFDGANLESDSGLLVDVVIGFDVRLGDRVEGVVDLQMGAESVNSDRGEREKRTYTLQEVLLNLLESLGLLEAVATDV